jgi:TPR repeat protein
LIGLGLVVGPVGIQKDVEAGKNILERAAAKGDRIAARAVGIGYANGELGTVEPSKAAAFLRKAADAGDPPAMLHYAYMLATGAAVERDEALAEEYLTRASKLGLTAAQETLGLWLVQRYKLAFTNDPTDAIRWLENAYQSGYSISALWQLGLFYVDAARSQWRDPKKAAQLLETCSKFAYGPCHYTYASCLRDANGLPRDLVSSYAHFEVARLLGAGNAPMRLDELKRRLTDDEKATALSRAKLIRDQLKPTPRRVLLQSQDKPASPWIDR